MLIPVSIRVKRMCGCGRDYGTSAGAGVRIRANMVWVPCGRDVHAVQTEVDVVLGKRNRIRYSNVRRN